MHTRASLTVSDRKRDGSPICSFAFTGDPNGNILTSLREDTSCWYYDYDGLQRLTEAEWKDDQGASLYGYEYNYDRVGNRASLAASGVSTYYSYNAANELTDEVTLGVETAYYTYDGRGNQTQRTVLGGDTLYFDYNSRNLITRIDSTEDGFTPNTFEYNALGQRIRKTDSTGTTYYVWDGLNITHEHDGAGTVTRRYTHGHTPIHGVFSLISVADELGCPCFYHLDQVGGVRRLTDAYENVVQTYEFSPFGRILGGTGSAPNDFTFPANTVRLADRDDVRLGCLRGYAAGTGRWLSRDRIRFVNRYEFALGGPLASVDPSSLGPLSLELEAKLRRLGPASSLLTGEGPFVRAINEARKKASQERAIRELFGIREAPKRAPRRPASDWQALRRAGRAILPLVCPGLFVAEKAVEGIARDPARHLFEGLGALCGPTGQMFGRLADVAAKVYVRVCKRGEGRFTGMYEGVSAHLYVLGLPIAAGGLSVGLGVPVIVLCDKCLVCFYLAGFLGPGLGSMGAGLVAEPSVRWGHGVFVPRQFEGPFLGIRGGGETPGLFTSVGVGGSYSSWPADDKRIALPYFLSDDPKSWGGPESATARAAGLRLGASTGGAGGTLNIEYYRSLFCLPVR